MKKFINNIKSWLRLTFNYHKYYYPSGEPIKCHYCNSSNLEDEIIHIDGGYPSEVEISCGDCQKTLSYFAYGFYTTEKDL